jgi:uncharacterized protein Yka (UPF0111/DUF47 family)
MKSEKEILALKKEVTDVRDKVIESKATYTEVVNNIENHKKELKDLGTDPEKVDEAISDMEQKIDDFYNKSIEKLKEWNK